MPTMDVGGAHGGRHRGCEKMRSFGRPDWEPLWLRLGAVLSPSWGGDEALAAS